MITFEKQKIIKPTARNSGASDYTLYRGEATDTKPVVAQAGDIFEEYDTGKVYVCSRDAKGRTVWTEDASAKRQTESGQTGLPPVTSTDNGKVLTVSNGAWAAAAATGGGGAEKFVVTLTEDDSGAETVWTADKTIEQIFAAKAAGKIIEALYPYGEGFNCILRLTMAETIEAESTVIHVIILSGDVYGGEGDPIYVNALGSDVSGDAWNIKESSFVPPYTAGNNGKVLGVSSGDLEWVDKGAITTPLTLNETSGKFESGLTLGEILTAFLAGNHITMVHDSNDGKVALAVVAASYLDNGYDVTYCGIGGSLATATGNANDHIEITV